MVRPFVVEAASHSQAVLAIVGLLLVATALVALCAKNSGGSARSLASQEHLAKADTATSSPRVLPKQLVASMSNKLVMSPRFRLMKKKDNEEVGKNGGEFVEEEEGRSSKVFGEGGVWQKSILMGDRCRPPQFSGPIYYDSQGNRLQDLPMSPRVDPVSTYFTPKHNNDTTT